MTWRIITAYTPEYRDEALMLFKSMDALDIRLTEYPFHSERSWEANTHRTVSIIRHAMDDFPDDDIVWVDADARFFRFPKFFDEIPAAGDLGVHKRANRTGSGFHYNSGTIYHCNRPVVRAYLDDQIARLKAYREHPDNRTIPSTDWMLRNTEAGKRIRIVELPLTYSYIEGTEQPEEQIPFGHVVIMHTQASRRLRSKIR